MYLTINYNHLNAIVSIKLSKIIPQVSKKRKLLMHMKLTRTGRNTSVNNPVLPQYIKCGIPELICNITLALMF